MDVLGVTRQEGVHKKGGVTQYCGGLLPEWPGVPSDDPKRRGNDGGGPVDDSLPRTGVEDHAFDCIGDAWRLMCIRGAIPPKRQSRAMHSPHA